MVFSSLYFGLFLLFYSLPGIMILMPFWFIGGVLFSSPMCQVVLIMIILYVLCLTSMCDAKTPSPISSVFGLYLVLALCSSKVIARARTLMLLKSTHYTLKRCIIAHKIGDWCVCSFISIQYCALEKQFMRY